MRILVVDDGRAVRDSLRRALELEGYDVELACDGQGALDYLDRGEQPDAIVLDVAMPRVGGIEVCALIRGSGSSVPIMMVSASREPATRAAALRVGASAYVTKPFALDDLLARLREILG